MKRRTNGDLGISSAEPPGSAISQFDRSYTNRLVLLREIIFFFSDSRKKYANALGGQNADFL
jgi:hypothetical protein